jgi:hypothetical protein
MIKAVVIFLLLLNLINMEKLQNMKKLIGYADKCEEKVYESVVNGVNMIIWFRINLIDGIFSSFM